MNIERVAPRGYFFAGFALALVACSGEAPQTDAMQTGSVEEPFIGGVEASPGTATSQGFVAIRKGASGLCSGTMLRPDVAITAKHCTTTNPDDPDASPDDDMRHYQLVMNPSGDFTCPNPAGACQARVPSIIYRSLASDVALIWLSDFMAFNSNQNRYDFNRLIYSGTDDSLRGAALQCNGYGNNVITQCTPTQMGTGTGKLQTATMTVTGTETSTDGPGMLLFTNTSGPLAFKGDSGSTCIFGGKITGIASTAGCAENPVRVISSEYTGPEAYCDWVNVQLDSIGTAAIHTASSANVSGNRTTLSDIRLNAKPDAFLYVTANFNPGGGPGFYNDAQLGVLYNTSLNRWQIFNENGAAMPIGAKFNYWAPNADASIVHTATAATIPSNMPHVSRLSFGLGDDGNPNLRLIVQQREGTNNHAVGVWFDTGSKRWYVYNEDGSPMLVGTKFNVVHASTLLAGFTHVSSSTNIFDNSTRIANPNLDNQPTAQFVVTHNFKAGSGSGGVYLTKAIGVWFDGAHWNIFNQDKSPMQSNLTFHIQPRP
jgi:hypothetical protein